MSSLALVSAGRSVFSAALASASALARTDIVSCLASVTVGRSDFSAAFASASALARTEVLSAPVCGACCNTPRDEPSKPPESGVGACGWVAVVTESLLTACTLSVTTPLTAFFGASVSLVFSDFSVSRVSVCLLASFSILLAKLLPRDELSIVLTIFAILLTLTPRRLNKSVRRLEKASTSWPFKSILPFASSDLSALVKLLAALETPSLPFILAAFFVSTTLFNLECLAALAILFAESLACLASILRARLLARVSLSDDSTLLCDSFCWRLLVTVVEAPLVATWLLVSLDDVA